MSETTPAFNEARRDALNDIADSLTSLAARLRRRAAVSHDFARLTERARAIAAQAWDVRTSRWSFIENTGRLADELVVFAREAAAASVRAQFETASNLELVNALVAQAGRIARVGQNAAVGRIEVRRVLEPLEAMLMTLQTRVEIDGSVNADAVALAGQAASLSEYALSLRGGVRKAEAAAAAIAKVLNVIIDEAALISSRMAVASNGLGDAVTRLASGARDAKRRYADREMGLVWS